MKSAIYILAIVGLFGCRSSRQPAQSTHVPELVLDGVGIRFFRGSELRAIGNAETATLDRDKAEVTARQLKLRLIGSARGDLRLTARDVRGDLRLQTAEAIGDVQLEDQQGFVSRTNRAELDGRDKTASGEDPVDLSGPGLTGRAESGFVLMLDEPGTLTLKGPVITDIAEAQ